MLAKSVPSIPPGAWYEPKWDGFRSICFKDGDDVELGSRNERPLTRYFPEVVEAITAELPERCVIDGEIIIATDHGLDFEALQQRIHPADSRVQTLAKQTPASFVAFDLLALGDDDYTGRPFTERRAALVAALAGSGPSAHVTPASNDIATAQRWFEGAGLDGVIAKPLTVTYQPDKRVMFKIKHQRTADCVIAGYRVHKSSDDAIGSLLLCLYTDDGTARLGRRHRCVPDGQTATAVQRNAAAGNQFRWSPVELGRPRMPAGRTPRKNETSRWNAGKDLSFVPLRPERVVEVRYDHMEGDRFRHAAQFNRWRPDRDPRSCTYAQLEQPLDLPTCRYLAWTRLSNRLTCARRAQAAMQTARVLRSTSRPVQRQRRRPPGFIFRHLR